MRRVAIIGTGLIGASVGLRLKAAGNIPDLEIAGFDRIPAVGRIAQRSGAVDVNVREPADAVHEASLVVLCTPVLALRSVMKEIAPALEDNAIVTDTGSTKTDVMRWAQEELPHKVSFIGGHPMAGKTDAGPNYAEATLFEGAQWVIVPPTDVPQSAVDTVRGLIEAMGAKPRFMDAEEHDSYVAAISHLPQMAATAMFTLAHESEAWPELSMLAATGFRDTTRLAGTDPNIGFDIAVTNRTQIVHWLERYREVLRELQDRLSAEDGEEELFRHMAQSSWDYTNFVNGEVGRKEIDERGDGPKAFDLTQLLIGEALASKISGIAESGEKRLEKAERERRLRREE